MNDSACLSGKLEKVSQHQLRMSCPGIAETVAVPVDRLQSIIMLSHDSFTPQEAGRTGRLELEGVRLKGSLTDSHDSTNGDASCLVWHPQSSQTGSPLRKDVFGRIVYRDPPPAAQKNPQATTVRGQLQGRQAGQVVIQGGGVLMLQGQQIQGPVVLNAVMGAVNNDQPPPAGAVARVPRDRRCTCVPAMSFRAASPELPRKESNFSPPLPMPNLCRTRTSKRLNCSARRRAAIG